MGQRSYVTPSIIAEARELYEKAQPRSQAEFTRIHRQEYKNKSLHWKNLRREMVRCGRPRRCEFCEAGTDTKIIDCHHLQYKHWWDVTVEDLVWLCRDCHNSVSVAQRNGTIPKKAPTSMAIAIRTLKFLAAGEHSKLKTEVRNLQHETGQLHHQLVKTEQKVATPQVVMRTVEVEKPVKQGISWITAGILVLIGVGAGMGIDGFNGPLIPKGEPRQEQTRSR